MNLRAREDDRFISIVVLIVAVILLAVLFFGCASSGGEDCTFSPVPGVEIPCAEPDHGWEEE